jgi:hypothetical protein
VAKLTTDKRDALPASSFVFPADRRYPIPDQSHAQNALARVSQNGTDAEKAKVRSAVASKFKSMTVKRKAAKQ